MSKVITCHKDFVKMTKPSKTYPRLGLAKELWVGRILQGEQTSITLHRLKKDKLFRDSNGDKKTCL